MIILLERQVPAVNASFHRLAPDLVRKETANEAVITIVLLPQGIVTSIVPVPEPDNVWYQVGEGAHVVTVGTGRSAASSWVRGRHRRRGAAASTAARAGAPRMQTLCL